MSENYCEECGENAYVAIGFGEDMRWLCMNHFNAALKGVRKQIDKVKDAITGPIPEE